MLLIVAAAAGAAPASAAPTAPGPASVTVVHGLRGLVADVSLDGRTVLQGFGAERATDPLAVPAGPHQLEVRRTGETGAPLISAAATLQGGASVSVVAHLDPSDNPVLSSFVNDTAEVPAGEGRLALRSAAATPSVQLVVDDQPVGDAVASGAETAQLLPTGAHTVTVQAPGTGQVLLPAQTVQVPAARTTALYLIGSPTDSSLGWLTQTLDTRAAAPAGVPTGNSGLKDHSVLPGYAGGLLLGLLALAGARSRSVAR